MSDVLFAGNAPVYLCVTSPFFCARDPFERNVSRPKAKNIEPGWTTKSIAWRIFDVQPKTIAHQADIGIIRSKLADGITLYNIDDIIKYAESTKETRAAWKKNAMKGKK